MKLKYSCPEGGYVVEFGGMGTVLATVNLLSELKRAEDKHPEWPTDVIHQAAIMAEKAGEAVRAALNYQYHGGSVSDIRKELAQTGAMCLRMLKNLPEE